ncbi:neuraminidase-like domain-containing protein [Pseudomonas mandelii]|uniref:Tc toxin subunit A-related protein n=1 Tax=Pseudomonas mandelii TaxID=75612 RepID=UPI003C72238D
MASNNTGHLLEKRRLALMEYCIGQVNKTGEKSYAFVKTPEDLFELLRLDPLDSYPVQNSWVAEAISCAQQYIHAVYQKLEPGYAKYPFSKPDLDTWAFYSNYPDWAALQFIAYYPENFINPFVRQRKTSLFKTLENDLNQSSLNTDSVQKALQNYLHTFEQTCDLEVISAYMGGYRGDALRPPTPALADYYFVGCSRTEPRQYFWRKAEVELSPAETAINPAAWSEWQPIEIPTDAKVLDIRPVFWNGRLCVVWSEWREKTVDKSTDVVLPNQLTIELAFMAQNGQWSAPLNLHESLHVRDVSADARLVATVLVTEQYPKGNLGVMLINGKSGEDALKVSVARDVLLRPAVDDDGGWLEQATVRFATPLTVQHALVSRPPMVVTDALPGSMIRYLGLRAFAFAVGNDDVLLVQGFCKQTEWYYSGATALLKLELINPASGDPAPIEQEFPIKGEWSTVWQTFRRARGGWSTAPVFSFGGKDGTGYGRKNFTITIADLPHFTPAELLKNTLDAAQFLKLNQADLALKYCRLNSLFGPELVQRSNISVDAVLDWDTQFLSEPPPTSVPLNEPNGAFDGANGLFFWELFFHLPHLVATRLRDENSFTQAQDWLRYLFDPQAIADEPSVPNPKPLYWRCRPLATRGNPGTEALNSSDPDAIGYAAPRHFQILVFTEYVNNLIAWGDWYYRQLTRDSLVAAKLCYVQARFLMGKAPSVRTVNSWETTTVETLLKSSGSRPALEQFERALDFSLADFPVACDNAPRMGLLANGPFKPPINQRLLDLFALPDQRLFNLRNNLTIEGSPLDIPLFSPMTDPNRLLRDLASGGVGGPRPMGGRLVVGAFRWRVTFEAALRAVQTLQEFANEVLSLLERRDRAEQEEMQQDHLVKLGAYAETMQRQTIDQLVTNVDALSSSRKMAQERAQAYSRLYDENVSETEYRVMDNLQQSKVLALTSSALKPAGAVIAAGPNIFGMAAGGFRIDALVDAVCYGLDIAASILQIDADKQATTEAYRRRAADWKLQRDQAQAEARAIDVQITAQEQAVLAARTSLEQILRANSQALAIYNFLKKRATNAELFNWMLGQLKALHKQAYDAVVSLCLSAQYSLSAETGDYDSQIPLPQVWLDSHHGLTAGEHLRAHLLRMEREYLQRHERRLELVKTISLRQLFDDAVDAQTGIKSWDSALQQLRATGSLEFRLTQLLFDQDHPGHYCRQISLVEVDLPALTGPYQDIKATLLQISSMNATKATAQSVKYLYNPDGAVAPADVQVNLRSGQQIALSMGLADNGMTAMKPDDGLLNPFENTGLVSRWMLNFPWAGKDPQRSMLESLTDIIVRIRYTAKVGEPTFTRKVEDMVNVEIASRQNNQDKGAGDDA